MNRGRARDGGDAGPPRRVGRGGLAILAMLALGLATAGAPQAAEPVRVLRGPPAAELDRLDEAGLRFSAPMVALGGGPAPDPARSDCPQAGQGRWTDERTWVLAFSPPLPAGTRCTLRLTPGLRALDGQAVAGPRAWPLRTAGPAVRRALPEAFDDRPPEVPEDAVFLLELSGPVDPATLRAVHCRAALLGEALPVQVLGPADRAATMEALGVEDEAGVEHLALRCARPLPPGDRVELVWGAGVATPDGVATRKTQRLPFRVRPPFTAQPRCERERAGAGCMPIRPLALEFSAPVPRAVAAQVRLRRPDGQRLAPTLPEGESHVERLEWPAPRLELATVRLELPEGLRDDAGRPLANAADFPLPVALGPAPALAKLATGRFGVLEWQPGRPSLLPLTLRRLEGPAGAGPPAATPAQVRVLRVDEDLELIAWLARFRALDEVRLPLKEATAHLGRPPPEGLLREGEVDSRALSLLADQPGVQVRPLPAAPAASAAPAAEVIGLPLDRPGLHLVEISSPRLGAALLEPAAPMQVRGAVLVTGMAVHLKVGLRDAAVWVTTLEGGRPVAGAALQIHDCRGRRLWSGRSDAQGLARLDQPLPRPREGCGSGEGEFFASARRATPGGGPEDLAFAWSGWNEGLEAWRFNVPPAWGGAGEPAPLRLHTVLDRSLLRAGEVVSMKHLARVERLDGLDLAPAGRLPDRIRLTHLGSGQSLEQPLAWRGARHAESRFELPPETRLGRHEVELLGPGDRVHTTASLRVESFKLPLLRGRIEPPSGPLVAPSRLPLAVQLAWADGGPAAGLPVLVSAELRPAPEAGRRRTAAWPDFSFEPPRPVPPAGAGASQDGDDEPGAEASRLVADKRPLRLDAQGQGRLRLDGLPPPAVPSTLQIQASYPDPNGELQSLVETVTVWPAALQLGLKAPGWVRRGQAQAFEALVLDLEGRPLAGRALRVEAVRHRLDTTRRRLLGGFYAYDHRRHREALGEVCRGRSDAQGRLACTLPPQAEGELELVARADDGGGREAASGHVLWVHGEGLWFGGDRDDRMELRPERRRVQPGETARIQVRMPFRQATAWITVERDGLLLSRVQTLEGRDPVIELPVDAAWGPNVYVSVLAVRGRLQPLAWSSFFTEGGWRAPRAWWARWRESREAPPPTATLDLAKPAFKLGLTELEVGGTARQLQVEVLPAREAWPLRARAEVRLRVRGPDGRPPPAGTELVVAAVDEALLELLPNPSWDLAAGMLPRRGHGIETATGQSQVVGRRHFGRKALAPGGDGGGLRPTRELLDTLLLWAPQVALDAAGEARVEVPLNDTLGRFRVLAAADAQAGGDAWFGHGHGVLRSTQAVQLVPGLPARLRTGDRHRLVLTLRRTGEAPQPLRVRARHEGLGPPRELVEQRLSLAPGQAQTLHWEVEAPDRPGTLRWTFEALDEAGGVQDRIGILQPIDALQPLAVEQALTLALDGPLDRAVAAPPQALPGPDGRPRGGLSLALRPSLATPPPGVQEALRDYPWTCLEQQASRAVGLGDPRRWAQLVERLPLHLDAHGLADFFPPLEGQLAQGSDSLTVHLLRLSEAAGPGFEWPETLRRRLEAGLQAFVDGRVRPPAWGEAASPEGREARRVAALERLARRGPLPARELPGPDARPEAWPTESLIDWIQLLERLPPALAPAARREQAEALLRSRLRTLGRARLLREDGPRSPLGHPDLDALRLLHHAAGRPAWAAELPGLLEGALQRQRAGAWATPGANAWGVLALRELGRAAEAGPVAGQTRAGWAGEAPQALDWAASSAGGRLELPWPASAPPGGPPAVLQLRHQGPGRPWLTLEARAARHLAAPESRGYRLSRRVEALEQAQPGRWQVGDVLRVVLELEADSPQAWVVVEDPLPGGARLLGSGLGRDSPVLAGPAPPPALGPEPAWEERRPEAYRAYFRSLPAGRVRLHYTLRLNTAGRFQLPPSRVEALYSPELAGRWPNAAVDIAP